MKTSLQIGLAILLLFSCKEQKKHDNATAENRTEVEQETFEGTIQLTLDGKTYLYDDIDWDKSRVKYDGEDVRLKLRQEKLPVINFRFPDIHESLAEFSEFKIPDVMRGRKSGGFSGFNSPITLNFQVYEQLEDRHPKGVVSFHKGTLTASFDDGHLQVEFEGEGRKALTEEEVYFPVSGTIDIDL